MNPAMVELLARLDQARAENAEAFVVVTIDQESHDVVHASGPFAQAEQALVEAARLDADWRAHAAPGEGDFAHVVTPMWGPGQ